MTDLKMFYTLEEASKHNTKEDCWIIIDAKVYDVTHFLYDHPAGDDVLINATGRDAKEDFEFVGHSENARELMKQYCIGELDPSSLNSQFELSTKQQKTTLISHTKNKNNMTFKYWVIPVAVLGISLVSTLLYFPSK